MFVKRSLRTVRWGRPTASDREPGAPLCRWPCRRSRDSVVLCFWISASGCGSLASLRLHPMIVHSDTATAHGFYQWRLQRQFLPQSRQVDAYQRALRPINATSHPLNEFLVGDQALRALHDVSKNVEFHSRQHQRAILYAS